MVGMQAKFEFLKSQIYPKSCDRNSQLFFIVMIDVKSLPGFEELHKKNWLLDKVKLILSWYESRTEPYRDPVS